jgi:hypothetical protein
MRTKTSTQKNGKPPVGAKLARDGDLKDAIAGKPCSYRDWGKAKKKGSSRNPGKHRNKNADLVDDVRASKHI